mmetsp:Transcript_136175/g.248256  ORF Transcript_136175/g.248256 Transcript_136175/m.248256 type:complete len:100 (+) Transcript_136175:413-712(+)
MLLRSEVLRTVVVVRLWVVPLRTDLNYRLGLPQIDLKWRLELQQMDLNQGLELQQVWVVLRMVLKLLRWELLQLVVHLWVVPLRMDLNQRLELLQMDLN